VKKSFNIQELLHRKSKRHERKLMHPSSSKHHETKLMHPSSLSDFERDQKHNLKHPGSVDLKSTTKTKQNKTKQTNNLPS
jgi:hypothetical protein